MKKTNKTINIFGKILMLVFVFLCGFNVVYAYFTARATVEGGLTFYEMKYTFGYKTSGNNQATSTGETEFTVNPDTVNLLRGVSFGFKTSDGTQTITSLGIMPNVNNCDGYVRFKVNAYKMEKSGNSYTASSDTTNYGSYIILTKTSSVVTDTDGYYYIQSVISASADCYDFATGATISISAPADLTDSYLKITISYEAVQANKTAVTALWGSTAAGLLP